MRRRGRREQAAGSLPQGQGASYRSLLARPPRRAFRRRREHPAPHVRSTRPAGRHIPASGVRGRAGRSLAAGPPRPPPARVGARRFRPVGLNQPRAHPRGKRRDHLQNGGGSFQALEAVDPSGSKPWKLPARARENRRAAGLCSSPDAQTTAGGAVSNVSFPDLGKNPSRDRKIATGIFQPLEKPARRVPDLGKNFSNAWKFQRLFFQTLEKSPGSRRGRGCPEGAGVGVPLTAAGCST